MDTNDLSDNINDNQKPLSLPKKKLEKYSNERKEIMDKIFEILNIQIENGVKFFYVDDITDEKQKEITDMKDKIKRYFMVSGWMTYKNTVKLERVHMSLIRNLLKHENINYTITTKMLNGIRKTKYILLDNNEV